MTESEFLERFDEHVARMDVALVDIGEELRLSRQAHDAGREAHEDSKAFMRDLTRRNELVFQGVMKQLLELTAETTGMRTQMTEQTSQMTELTAQTRAHTQALLNVLDRLN